ncbi:hypothetical protein PAHAL_7G240400 [Panicum hallii]|uniref:Phytocyanin domain-containing protein n=1 Tax=Panicum hallii TaxID=206008 RepID=A0A2S3I905_9POAL|nr:mavicyanin-like [Panicum hallii]PAN39409.1 hypothetical protein PAHAL_7G240400 [Panicum hallii]
MAGTQRGLLLAILLVVAGVPASAKDYTVGGSSGWKPGVDYAAWAKGKPFSVGDTLSFQYDAAHSVLEVSEADHGACSASNPLRSHRDQSTTIPLTKPGTRYFICGAAGHCAAGMKLAVTVSGGDSAPATTASSGPSMRSTNATPAAGSTAAATESDSSASGAAAASGALLTTGLLLGAVGLAAMMG